MKDICLSTLKILICCLTHRKMKIY